MSIEPLILAEKQVTETLRAAQRELAEKLAPVLVDLAHYPEQTEQLWRAICQDVRVGREPANAASLHSLLKQLFEQRLQLLYLGCELASAAHSSAERNGHRAAEFQQIITRMETFRSIVLDGWNTYEELEDKLASEFPLSREKLAQLATKHPAPADWHCEESKPF